jgi:hypothetical protein
MEYPKLKLSYRYYKGQTVELQGFAILTADLMDMYAYLSGIDLTDTYDTKYGKTLIGGLKIGSFEEKFGAFYRSSDGKYNLCRKEFKKEGRPDEWHNWIPKEQIRRFPDKGKEVELKVRRIDETYIIFDWPEA